MIHVTAALLDLTNIVGGFLLAAVLLADLPRIGAGVARVAAVAARATLTVGVLALVMGGYYFILHLATGPHVFHFELVGIGVGVALLRDRLFPRASGQGSGGPPPPQNQPGDTPVTATLASGAGADLATARETLAGGNLLLAVFGLIAVVVGLQGLFTLDG